MKNVKTIVLHYKGAENTQACITSLCKMTIDKKKYSVEIVVVDNGLVEPFDLKETHCQLGNIVLIRNQENKGYAGGMNTGISYAQKQKADYVIVLNNDIEVDREFLSELLKTAEQKDAIGIVVPKIYFYPGTEYHYDRYDKKDRGKVIWYAGGIVDWDNIFAYHRGVDEIDKGQYDKSEETPFATGCCMLLRRELLDDIGLFDENYFLYYEDNDFSQRTMRRGYKIMFAPKAILWHKNAKSAGGVGSVLQDYYITRNRLLFGTRYARLRSKIALLRESVKLLLIGRKWQKIGVIDFYRRKYKKGSFPIA